MYAIRGDTNQNMVLWLKDFNPRLRVRTIYTEADHNSELFHNRKTREYPRAYVFLPVGKTVDCLKVTITAVSANSKRKIYPVAFRDINEPKKESLTINGPLLQYEYDIVNQNPIEILFDHIEVRQIKRQLENTKQDQVKSNNQYTRENFNGIFLKFYGITNPDLRTYPEAHYYGLMFKYLNNFYRDFYGDYGDFDPFLGGLEHYDGLENEKNRTKLNKFVKSVEKINNTKVTFFLCINFKFMLKDMVVCQKNELIPIVNEMKTTSTAVSAPEVDIQMPIQSEMSSSRVYQDSISSISSSGSNIFDTIQVKESTEVGTKSKKMRLICENEASVSSVNKNSDSNLDLVGITKLNQHFSANQNNFDYISSTEFSDKIADKFHSSAELQFQNFLDEVSNQADYNQYLPQKSIENSFFDVNRNNLIYKRLISQVDEA